MTNDNMILDEEQARELAETAHDDASLDAPEAPAQPEPIVPEEMPQGRARTAAHALAEHYGAELIPQVGGGYWFGTKHGTHAVVLENGQWNVIRRYPRPGRSAVWTKVCSYGLQDLELALRQMALMVSDVLGILPAFDND